MVLESDGTTIDENEALKILHKEVFILLQKNEIWLPLALATKFISGTSAPCASSDSTITNLTDDFNISSTPLTLDYNPRSEQNVTYIPVNTELSSIIESSAIIKLDKEIIPSIQGKENINEETWRKFEIPWNKFSTNVLRDIEQGKRCKQIFNEVVKVLVDEMRCITKYVCCLS